MLPPISASLSGGTASGEFGPISGPPVTVNVSGFGGFSAGGSKSAAVPEADAALGGGVSGSIPMWAIFAAAGLALLAFALRR